MIKTSTAARLGLVAALALGATALTSSPATADQAPTSTDVVGVGSDIVQNSLNFLADGDIHSHLGYNSAGNKNRLISFDATADANGRNAFSDPTGAGGAVVLNPTVTLRAGTSPVQRPNGGGAGLNALLADTTGEISFVRSPNLPTSAQQTTATNTTGVGQLHSVEFAEDKQVIATASTTNAPATLTAAQLVDIYEGTKTKWNQVGGTSTDTIIPLIPQNGAGVQKIFLNALKAAKGSTISLGQSVRFVQQNDPTTITGLSAAERPDAIVPFPIGRYTLLGSGYFRDPNAPYNPASPPAALNASGLSLLTGASSFSATIPYFVIFRESDAGSATPWQPGSDLNWVQELFSNPSNDPNAPLPYVATAPAQAILTAAGITAKYVDRNNDTSG